MNILLVSTLCSNRYLDELYSRYKTDPGFCIQKFLRLIALGLVANEANVYTITSIPVNYSTTRKCIFARSDEKEDGIYYHYLNIINLGLIRNLCAFIFSFFYTISWVLKYGRGIIIVDVLKTSICSGSLLAAKLTHTEIVGIVTDMPGMLVTDGGRKFNLKKYIISLYINLFDRYIMITKYMNDIINIYKKPFLVIEGTVNVRMGMIERRQNTKIRKILYAGALYDKYGIKMLVDAFNSLNLPSSVQLHLYGDGPAVTYIKKMSKINNNIVYHGVVLNDEIVEAELEAFLLVNPRPSSELFTKYSFPSKNMEYMVSGTPILTSCLSGMPDEYKNYVYLFRDETEKGLALKLYEIVSKSDEDVAAFGERAKQFVLKEKNNISQSQRILQFINE